MVSGESFMIRRLVVGVSAVVIAAVAILALWLGRDTTPELPPLRPLVEPSYEVTPIPETTTTVPTTAPGGYVDDSVIGVRDE